MASLRDVRPVLRSCGMWTFLKRLWHQLDDDGHICGVNVRSDLRNRGIGNYMAACVTKYIMDFVNRDGKPRLIHTYNYNCGGVPWPLLQKLGYEIVSSIGQVQTDFGVLPIWSKTYSK